jgi:hypothetical protein
VCWSLFGPRSSLLFATACTVNIALTCRSSTGVPCGQLQPRASVVVAGRSGAIAQQWIIVRNRCAAAPPSRPRRHLGQAVVSGKLSSPRLTRLGHAAVPAKPSYRASCRRRGSTVAAAHPYRPRCRIGHAVVSATPSPPYGQTVAAAHPSTLRQCWLCWPSRCCGAGRAEAEVVGPKRRWPSRAEAAVACCCCCCDRRRRHVDFCG